MNSDPKFCDSMLFDTSLNILGKLAKLISRTVTRTYVVPSEKWDKHWYKNRRVQMEYDVKVDCKPGFSGNQCKDVSIGSVSYCDAYIM